MLLIGTNSCFNNGNEINSNKMQNYGVIKTATNVEVQSEQLTSAMEDFLFLLFLREAIKDNLNHCFLLKNEAR